ncbi:hypothetical protein ACF0H5_000145 [Mactra antiquata]
MADMGCKMLFLISIFWILSSVVEGSVYVYMCPSTRTVRSGINVAHLTVNTAGVDSNITLQMISSECHNCDLQNATYIPYTEDICTVIVDTRWPVKLAIINDSNLTTKCSWDKNKDFTFLENGNYSLYITEKGGNIHCTEPVIHNDPEDANIALYVTLGVFAGLALIWISIRKGRRGFLKCLSLIHPKVVDTEAYSEQDLGTPTNVLREHGNKRERLRSLDSFRGISLVIMMFVNYGGADYWFFNHSKWNGLTVADLVFPWFIWIMGTSMSFSYQSLVKHKVGRGKILLKVLRRSIILFLLGFLVSSGGSDNFTNWRFMGVLQRFAFTYLLTAGFHTLFMTEAKVNANTKLKNIRDITNYWMEWIVQLALLLIHTCLTFLLPVPGCPTGYLGPGGLADHGEHKECTGGAAGYIDRQILGNELVYGSPTCKEIYETNVKYDPEGLLGILTSTFLCFLGLQAGKILVVYRNPAARVKRFLMWGIILGALATLLCKASKNDGWIPINKNLWSLSYILAMASMAYILFCFCYVIIDVFDIWTGAPFFYPGMNSIVVYVCHEVFSQPFMTFWDIKPYSHYTYMLINVCDVSFWIMLSVYLHYKQIFISV